MAWDYGNGLSFYRSGMPRLRGWRFAIFALVAVTLWFPMHRYLEPVDDPRIIGMLGLQGKAGCLERFIEFVLYLYFRTPAYVKLIVMTAIFGHVIVRVLQAMLALAIARPFLTVSHIGLMGTTGWGKQLVPWWDVTAINIVTRHGKDGPFRQMVISTGTLARPEGWRAWLMEPPQDADRVVFITPECECSQLPQIIQAIRFYAPLHLRAAGEPTLEEEAGRLAIAG